MNRITFGNNHITLVFSINENKEIRLSFIGKDDNYLNSEVNHHSFLECEISEDNHFGTHNGKHIQTPFGIHSKYVNHSVTTNNDSKELIVISKDNNLEIESHFVLYNGASSFTTYNVVKNISSNDINLEYISSFYLFGLGQDNSNPWEDMFIHFARNSWHMEAQWRRFSFLDLGLFNGNNNFSMRQFALTNNGSWSTKDYLPMIVIENSRKKQFILSQIENNGSWHIEVSDLYNRYYVSMSGPDLLHNSFSKVIHPGETFVSCKATTSIGNSFEKVIQEITKARRHFVYKNSDYFYLPVIFNDYMHGTWDNSGEALVRPMADLAVSVGCEEFVMDAGWFSKTDDWPDRIGEWEEEPSIWPSGGLQATCDYIHALGMRVGLWFEIENMGLDCSLIQKFPKEYFFMVNGGPTNRHTRYCLNFAHEEVYKWAMDLLTDRIQRYQLDYIKLDYNVDTGLGNEFNSNSLGDGLLKHNRAFIRFLKELESKFPDLTIENCGSGGCRMDYEMLKVCSLQSTSDQTDYRKYPYLSGAVLTAVIPEQAAVWSYPVSALSDEPITDEVVTMNMVNAMLGRIHSSSYLNKLTPFQLDLVKEGVNYYKSTKEFKIGSLPIYPNGISYFFDKDVVAGLIKDKKIILCVWNTSGENRTVSVDLKDYDIDSIKVTYPLSLPTEYSYQQDNKQLKVKFDVPYGGRIFEIMLK